MSSHPVTQPFRSTLDAIMEQAQVFASTYSLVGGRFDDGAKMQQSEKEKSELRRMVGALTPPPVSQMTGSSKALLDVAAERRRQIEVEGFDDAHDDAHKKGELVGAGVCYALAHCKGTTLGILVDVTNKLWPFSVSWLKADQSRRDLVKAAALILAEIERLDRFAIASSEGPSDAN